MKYRIRPNERPLKKVEKEGHLLGINHQQLL